MSGISSIEDIRGRCFVDDITGCWLWRGAMSGGKHPSLWLAPLARHTTMGQAIAFFKTGELPEKGVIWYCQCATKGCANPDHRRAGGRSHQMRNADLVRSPMTRARMALGKRAGSRLTDEAAAEIRLSVEPLRVLAERFAISISHASQIRRGEQRRAIAARGASIFNMGSQQ